MDKLSYITQLELNNFRIHKYFKRDFSKKPVFICGKNGVGKTSILEAISFFISGKGFNNCNLHTITSSDDNNKRWSIAGQVNGIYQPLNLYTEYNEAISSKRSFYINDNKITANNKNANEFSIIWSTPDMELIFLLPPYNRRKFFDRLAISLYPQYNNNLSAYKHVYQHRQMLIKDNSKDNTLYTTLENIMVDNGIALAATRILVINRLGKYLHDLSHNFIKLDIKIDGFLENYLIDKSATQVEEIYRKSLYENRHNIYNEGPHIFDLLVYNMDKNIHISSCSTGEQRIVLLLLLLSQAYAHVNLRGYLPIMLIDELMSHIDIKNRSNLYKLIFDIGMQVWLTGIEIDDNITDDKIDLVNL